MTNDRLVILAGGVSSRMRRPASSAMPIDERLLRDAAEKSKSMIGVGDGDRPFLDYLLFNAREAGFRDLVIVVGEQDGEMRRHYGPADRDNSFHGLSISYVVQPVPEGRKKPLGTADALVRALRSRSDWQGGAFTVCNSDNLYSVAALRALLETTAECAMIDYDRSALEFEHSRIEQFAVIRKSQDGFLEDIIEKPSPDDVKRAKDANGRIGVSMNIFRLAYDIILPYIETVPLHPVRNEKELPVAVRMLVIDRPKIMRAIPMSEHVVDLTNRDDIPRVREYLLRTYPTFTMELSKNQQP
jgi:glucose-1-phosphate adenylyltransferase